MRVLPGWRSLASAAALLLALARAATAQAPIPDDSSVAVLLPRAVFAGALPSKGSPLTLPRRTSARRHDWWAPIASAVVPGTGQARLGQDRFVAYLAVESFLWTRYLVHRRQGIQERSDYRDLALRVSRAPFGGAKPQGDFEYYERMEHWIASGQFDADPGSTFAPETDTTTFNGAMWLLARRTYWSSPTTPPPSGSEAYQAALRFYERYAVGPEFQWSWRDAPLHQDVYRRHIRASNDAFRRTITDVGAVIANHVLSTVDAYVSLRLRMRDAGPVGTDGIEVSASLPIPALPSLSRAPRDTDHE